MRILHIMRGLALAGAENHLITLLAGLREQDFDARLLLWVSPARRGEDVMAAAAERGIPAESWIMPRHLSPAIFARLVRTLRADTPDIVHTHLVHAETYGIPAARLARVRYVVNSSHNDDPFRRHPVFRVWNRTLWRMTHRGIAISGAIKQFLVEVEGAREDQVSVIHYGYQPQALPPLDLRAELGLPDSARLIGSVCRLVPQKGLAYGLRAFAEIAPKFPDVHYVLAGDGPLRADLSELAAGLGLAERVHFLGWRADAPAIMANLEVFLAPSLWEGFGLVFLEAMSVACPIVASRVSAVPEIIADGMTGCLVPPEESGAIAAVLDDLLSNPERAKQMGLAGQKRLAAHFSQQKMVDATAALYRGLVGLP